MVQCIHEVTDVGHRLRRHKWARKKFGRYYTVIQYTQLQERGVWLWPVPSLLSSSRFQGGG